MKIETLYYSKMILDIGKEELSIIVNWFEKEFADYYMVFRATGLWDNIVEIKNNHKDYIIGEYFGDKDKIFQKRDPELHFLFKKISFINNILIHFCNIIYEGRYIYIVKNDYCEKICDLLTQYVYKDDPLINYVYPYCDCIIENCRGYDGGFSLEFYFKEKNMLDSFMNALPK